MANENGQMDTGSASGCGGGSCCSGPGKWIWIGLAVAIIAVVIARNMKQSESLPALKPAPAPSVDTTPSNSSAPAATADRGQALPRLLDLGATKCVPCKMMAPILEDLKKTYAGKMDVQFIDVREKPAEAKVYGIRVIPTQIFFSPDGKELFRHEGFYGKEDILAKWKDLGIEL